jgi:hypothetical protein
MEDAVKEDFTISPSISNWPYRSFKQFKKYAREQAGDCYWMAIDKLMERSKRLEILERDLEMYEEQESSEETDRPLTLGD